jgi:K+-sensing histidine kinase KdpD
MPEGLMTSLRELAERTRQLYDVDCRFECSSPVLVHQHHAATHLYRIAQEAVNNSIKHGRPSRIRIKLASSPDRITLGIRDNGVGIRRANGDGRGLGLHIMQYRANALSGSLVVQRTRHGGTEVVCTTRRECLQEKNEDKNHHRNETETPIAEPESAKTHSRRGRSSPHAGRHYPVDRENIRPAGLLPGRVARAGSSAH